MPKPRSFMSDSRSFSGVVLAAEGSLLLGGVKRHESSRFPTAALARKWVEVIWDTNEKAGRKPASAAVVGSSAPPDYTEDELNN